MWILIIVLFLCIYKILDSTRELQELRGEIQRLQEDAGRRQTQAQQDHRNVQALEQSAKELEDGLEAVSSRSKAKDAVIASLEERLSALTDEKKQLAKAKDQALLDAKRALSSISSSGKGAKNAFQQKEMAEADRDKAHKEMKEAQETAARAEAAAAEAIQDRDRVLALKASIDAQAAMNDRIRADLHTAHEVQTKAEADRYAAQEAAAAAAAECAAAEAARDAALEAQKSVEETLKAAHEDLEAKHIALIEALNRAEAAEKTREKEVSIWKQRTAETEKNLVAEEDKMLATQKQFTSMMAKFAEVDAGYDATLDQVKILEKELKLRENVAGNLRIQLENEVKNTEEAKNQLEEALKEQKRLEMELVAAEEAAVQSAEEEILSVRRELEASLADSDGEIKNLKAQLDAATVNAAKSVDESAERLQEVEEELENVKMALVTAMQEQDRLQSAVVAAETELKAIHAELEESKKAQISGVSNARDELHKEIQLEISRRDVAEKNLESLKMELEAANNARDSAKAEVEDLIKAQNAAAEVQANTSATMDTKSSLLLDELAVLKKKNEEHEVELAALLDAKASAEIKLEDFKKSNQKELDNLRELNRRLLSREKSGRQGTNTSAAAAAAAAAAGVEEGLQSPAVKKASTDMAEKMDTLKKSTDKLFSAHRSSPGGGIKTAGPAATPTRSPLSRSSLDTKTP